MSSAVRLYLPVGLLALCLSTSIGAAGPVLIVDQKARACNDLTGKPAFCSLGPAIAAAAPGAVVQISAGVYAGPDNRQIDFYKSLTLLGAGPGATVLDGGGHWLMRIGPGESEPEPGIQVVLAGLGITHAAIDEPALHAQDIMLELNDVALRFNPGGALTVAPGSLKSSGLRISQSLFEGNRQAVISAVPVEITDSLFTTNFSEFQDRAAAVEGSGEIRDSAFIANGGEFQGGAVFFRGVIRNSRFVGNQGGFGGAVRIAVSGALAPGDSLLIDECEFVDNEAVRGGALSAEFFNFRASRGAGSHVVVRNTTFARNRALFGGAVYSESFSTEGMNAIRLVNNTFSENHASVQGGGLFAAGQTALNLDFNTFAGNLAEQQGSGMFLDTTDTRLSHTVLAGAAQNQCFLQFGFQGASHGYNLSEDASCSELFDRPDDLNQVPAGLGPLADNGGPTPTHLPIPGAAVIDSGAGQCQASDGGPVDRDQRAASRPFGLRCDRGAVEFGSLPGDGLGLTSVPVPTLSKAGLGLLLLLLGSMGWRALRPLRGGHGGV